MLSRQEPHKNNQWANCLPMYWWSNIATVENVDDRVIVPANQTYIAERGMVEKINVPHYNGTDLTYPSKNRYANDYFFKTETDSQKYICQLNNEGYGLFQSSTDRLKGRKLFVEGLVNYEQCSCNPATVRRRRH